MPRKLGLLTVLFASACTTGMDFPDAGPGVDAFIPAIDAGTDAGPPPPSCDGGVSCDGTCTDTLADDLNCGRCDNPCAPGVHCVGGRCACDPPRQMCGDLCVDTQSDATSCGGCDMPCPFLYMCTLGQCVPSCDPPRTVCIESASGTEVAVCTDPLSDPMHCGSCGAHCAAIAVCESGHCVCPDGGTACSGACYDVTTDINHCGSCLNTCGEGGICFGGECTTCGTGRTYCNNRCIDLASDRANCGACGNFCPGRESCVDSTCACADPLIDCGLGCIDPNSDANHCGNCETSCGPGGFCSLGTCTCAVGLDLCDGTCTNLRTDRNNCSKCGMACGAGEICSMAACTGAPPTTFTLNTPSASDVPFIDACAATGHLTLLTETDDDTAAVTLPFDFRYFASDLAMGSSLTVCSNGWLSMSSDAPESLGGSVPSTSGPNAVIAAHWTDGYTSATGICVATIGSAPNQQLVVEWADAAYCCDLTSGVHNTFEIILNEASGAVDLVYETMTLAHAGTMGIEDETGANGFNACPGGMSTCIPTDGQRVEFQPAI